MEKRFIELLKIVKPLISKKDPMHNFAHIVRIQKKVIFLKKQYENIDEDFLNFLIYTHEVRKWVQKNKKDIIRLGFPSKWIGKINVPDSPEGKIVWDANILENVGRFGIKKSKTLEKHYKQTRAETLDILRKQFVGKYRFYTPLGKKLGNPAIKIKKKWISDELKKLKK